MKVILQQEVKKLGKKGDILEVAEGYARNFLFPKQLALPATDSNVNVAKQQKASEEHRKQRALDEAKVMAAQLNKVEVTLSLKTGEGGKLFGSVTAKDIADALNAQHGIDMDKRKLEIKETIKSLGSYPVVIRVHPEITSQITVHIKGA